MAGPERIELPPSVSKTEMISISPRTLIGFRETNYLSQGLTGLSRMKEFTLPDVATGVSCSRNRALAHRGLNFYVYLEIW